MKKIFLVLVLLGSTMLMAEGATEEEMRETMQSLETSMSSIQKGFLYNHRGRIQQGISSLRKQLKNIDSFIIKNDKDVKFNAHKYAMNETKALDILASKILNEFDSGDKEAVLTDYNKILNGCVTCHALVRRW